VIVFASAFALACAWMGIVAEAFTLLLGVAAPFLRPTRSDGRVR